MEIVPVLCERDREEEIPQRGQFVASSEKRRNGYPDY